MARENIADMRAFATDRSARVVDVAVGLLQRADGRVLLAQRPRGKVSAGYWELPGGKLERGESVEHALARELQEEVGVVPVDVSPWLTYEHAYPDKVVRLHVYRVRAWRGTPHGREGQPVTWEDPSAPTVGPLLPANAKVLNAVALPSVCAIVRADGGQAGAFLDRLAGLFESGVRLVILRVGALAPGQRLQFFRRAVMLGQRDGARILLHSDESLARKAGAHGMHLCLSRVSVRTPLLPFVVSCHDAAELADAARLGADFALFSPRRVDAASTDQPHPAWLELAQRAHGYALPVYVKASAPKT